MSYDVIVAGASFAGLAVAQRLHGRVLLLDREPLGEGVTSACAAPVSVVEAMGAAESIQDVHDRLVLHTPRRSADWPLPEPFCTFDYGRFCRSAFGATGAEFRRTAVSGRRGATVLTGEGETSARFLIDATGWRAALVSVPGRPQVDSQAEAAVTSGSARRPAPEALAEDTPGPARHQTPEAVRRTRLRPARRRGPGRFMAFGIESEVAADVGPGLHFYFLPEVRDGYAWAFPCGGAVRFGVLSYFGRTKLWPGLARFMGRFGLRPGAVHGGYLASGFHEPVVQGTFVVGDAAGQCLPLTGEGIRTAILAGFRAGELVQDVLDGRRTHEEAASEYRRFVAGARREYRALLWGNLVLLVMPLRLTGVAAAYLSRPGPLRAFTRHYLGIFSGSPGPVTVPR
jgi:flavin-dependent dehydrogenase